MFISVVGSGKNKYVYLLRSRRVNGKVCTEKVENFGRYDELVKNDPDAVDKLKKKYAEAHRQISEAATSKALAAIEQESSPSAESSTLGQPELQYSNFILKQIWDNELNLHKTLYYLQSNYYQKLGYDLNQVLSNLVFLRTYQPDSICGLYRQKACLLGAPFEDTTVHGLYDCLSILHKHKELIFKTVNRQLDQLLHRQYRMVFYDVTNVYFETDLTDDERNYLRENCAEDVKDILTRAVDNGTVILAEGESIENYNLLKAPSSIQGELKAAMYFRTRGPSKEHRYDLPLISVALVIDENAIPVDFEVYSGCASEFKTMQYSIQELKEKYGIRNVIVVADRGLNSTQNLHKLLEQGYGFIVAQKVTNLDKKVYEQMFDSAGYVTLSEHPADAEGVIADSAATADVVRRKVLDFTKYDHKNNLRVDCKLVITHSTARERRDKLLLKKVVNKARTAIQANTELPLSRADFMSYIRKKRRVKSSEKTHDQPLELNFEAIEKAYKLCGYSALVYHNCPSAKTADKLTDAEIAKSYHHLVQIEECFRIMKNNLQLRPMYVWTEEHIRGHVCCCVLALILLRRLQMRSGDLNLKLSIDEIQNGLGQAKVSMQFNATSDGEAVFHKTTDYSFLYKGMEKASREQLQDKIEQLRGSKSLSDLLMEAVNLTPLPQCSDRAILTRHLKTKYGSDDKLVDSILYDIHTKPSRKN